jgi:hypothetical protein
MVETYGSAVLLGVIAIAACYMLYRWQHNHPNFDLSDLLTGDNGKVSLAKFGQAAALIVSTWGFVALVQQGKLTESYFVGYMGIWAGYRLAQSAIGKQAENQNGLSKPNTTNSPPSCSCPPDRPVS